MSKLITVWGSPESGKTTFAVKLAREIYKINSAAKIICVFPDMTTPTLPVIFPNKKPNEFFSIGKLLNMAEFTTNDVLSHFVLAKGIKNIVFMGYIYGENRYTYAEYTAEKANTFLSMCRYLGDYVIVDCSSSLDDKISNIAIQESDYSFRLASPTLKSISFLSSNVKMYSDEKYRIEQQIPIMNVTEQDVFMPVDDAVNCLGNIKHRISFCLDLKKQFYNGELLDTINNKKFQSEFQKICNEVLTVEE